VRVERRGPDETKASAVATLTDVRLVLSLLSTSEAMRRQPVVAALIERRMALKGFFEKGTPATWGRLVMASRRLRDTLRTAEAQRRPLRRAPRPAFAQEAVEGQTP
jgi:hypothetical protein